MVVAVVVVVGRILAVGGRVAVVVAVAVGGRAAVAVVVAVGGRVAVAVVVAVGGRVAVAVVVAVGGRVAVAVVLATKAAEGPQELFPPGSTSIHQRFTGTQLSCLLVRTLRVFQPI